MGNAKAKQQLYADAEIDYTMAIELNSNFAVAYLNRGISKERLRKFEEAIKDWEKAESLGISKARNYIKFYD